MMLLLFHAEWGAHYIGGYMRLSEDHTSLGCYQPSPDNSIHAHYTTYTVIHMNVNGQG